MIFRFRLAACAAALLALAPAALAEDSFNDGTIMIEESQTESEIDEEELERQACLKST